MPDFKPPSYWNDFSNVERELRAFIAQHGEAGIMPDHIELKRVGHTALSYAIGRHGGFERVAQRLGLQWAHEKKPRGYWADFANVERELRALAAELGQPTVMPTLKQLQITHRSGLLQAIWRKYGGSTAVALRLGLKTHQSARRKVR